MTNALLIRRASSLAETLGLDDVIENDDGTVTVGIYRLGIAGDGTTVWLEREPRFEDVRVGGCDDALPATDRFSRDDVLRYVVGRERSLGCECEGLVVLVQSSPVVHHLRAACFAGIVRASLADVGR